MPSYESPRIHGSSNLRTIPDGWRVLKTIIKLGMTPAPETRAANMQRPLQGR